MPLPSIDTRFATNTYRNDGFCKMVRTYPL
jgi:hypothetical protein